MTPVALSSKFYVAGYCEHRGAMTLKGDSWAVKKYPATCVLIGHPDGRKILFDTGYSTRFYDETERFPFSLYAKLTPVTVSKSDDIASLLEADGIHVDDIDVVVLSHFHADHMGGLKDFPRAKIIGTGAGYDHVRKLKGFSAVRRGYLPGLLPQDFASQFVALETSDYPYVDISNQLSVFHDGWDILGDGSLLAVPLPGHARGQFGLFYHDRDRGYIFLIADATWSSQAFKEDRKPHFLAYNALDDGRAYDKTITSLHTLHRLRPNIKIVPTHSMEAWELANEDAFATKTETKPATPDHLMKTLKWFESPDAAGEYWSRNGLKTYVIRAKNKDGRYWLDGAGGQSYESVADAKAAAAADHLAHVEQSIAELRGLVREQDYYPTPLDAVRLLQKPPFDDGAQV